MATQSMGGTGAAEILRRFSTTFLIEGIVLVILGLAAILLPQFASIAVALVLGWLFLIGGMIGLWTTIMARGMPGFWWSLASAIVTIAAGAFLAASPATGTVWLTLILTAFLIADGLLMILFGIEHRRQLSQRWQWFIVNGVIDLLLAAIIIAGLPGTAVWVLGLIIGIDLLFGGMSLISFALAARAAK
jgi:uncharacterized membrane protein HdeD (DUF308 family)